MHFWHVCCHLKSNLTLDVRILSQFKCRNGYHFPTNVKNDEIEQKERTIWITQQAYLHQLSSLVSTYSTTQSDHSTPITNDELSSHRTVAGRLAWIATPSSRSSSFPAKAFLGVNIKPISCLYLETSVLEKTKEQKLSSRSYTLIDFNSLHIRLYTDAAFQDLNNKHSQTALSAFLSDRKNRSNILHWQSPRAPSRLSATENSERLALVKPWNLFATLKKFSFSSFKNEIPVVFYIVTQTLWYNLINSTSTSLPKVMLRYREYTDDGAISSTFLISDDYNPANTFTRQRPNQKLLPTQILKQPYNTVETCVHDSDIKSFLLQHFSHLKFFSAERH